MIDVPESVKRLFQQDSVSKNFRVQFVNGEYRDLVNSDFVAESVVFTESARSSDNFKLGLGESSTIEFRTYFTENIRDMEIFCCIEIDISSLSSSEISAYGMTSFDVPYPFYRVPYGYFVIDSVSETGISGITSVVGYNERCSDDVTSKYIISPDSIKQACRWGFTKFTQSGNDEAYDIKVNTNNLVDAVTNGTGLIDRTIINTYTKSSSVFTRNDYEYSVFPDTITPQRFHTFSTPTVKMLYKCCTINRVIGHTGYACSVYLFVRGKEVYFHQKSSYGERARQIIFDSANNVDLFDTYDKTIARLDYVIKQEEDSVANKSNFAVSWGNSITLQDVRSQLDAIRTTIGEIGEPFDSVTPTYDPERFDTFTHGVVNNNRLLDWIVSPCIKFNDASIDFASDTDVKNKSSRDSSYTSEEQYARAGDYGIHDTYDKRSSKQRILNIPVVKKDGREEVVIYDDIFQFISEGINGEYQHREYTDVSNYSYVPNQIVLCVPTEVTFAIPNMQYAQNFDRFLRPYYSDEQVYFDFYTIQLNDFSSPKLEEFKISTGNEYIDQLYINIGSAKLSKWKDPEFTTTYDSENVYRKDYLKETRYVYSLSEGETNSIFSDSNLRSIVSSWAELQGKFIKYSRTKQYGLETITPSTGLLLPSEDLYPDGDVYPDGPEMLFERSNYYKLMLDSKSMFKYDAIRYIHRYFKYGDTAESKMTSLKSVYSSKYAIAYDIIAKIYDITDNFLLNNRDLDTESDSWSQSNIEHNLMWELNKWLSSAVHNKLTATIQGQPYLEAMDYIQLLSLNNEAVAYVLRHRISGIQSLKDDIEA